MTRVSTLGRVQSQTATVRGYTRLFGKLLRDSVWRFRKNALLMLATGMGALALQAGAMGVAIGYAQQLQSDATIRAAGRSFAVRESLEVLIAAAVIAAGLLILSSVLTYRSTRLIVRLRQDYESFCSARAFTLLASAPYLRFEHPDLSNDERSILRLARRDSRFVGRTLGLLGRSMMPAITLIVATAVLLYLAPVVTIAVAGVLAMSTPWVLRVNRAAANASRDLEERSPAASGEYRRLVRWLNRSPFELRDPEGLSASFLELEAVKGEDDAYSRRLMSTETAGLVGGMASGLALLVLVTALGGTTLRAGADFTVLFSYLIVLLRALASFRSLNRGLSGINRFYPQVKRYFAFVDEASQTGGRERTRLDCFRIHPRPADVERSMEHLDLRPPARVALVAPFAVTRYTLPRLAQLLLWKEPEQAEALWGSSTFATGSYEYLPGRPLRESLGIPEDQSVGTIRADLEGLIGAQRARIDWIHGLDQVPTPEVWLLLGGAAKFALAVLAADRSDADWVFLDEKGLSQLDRSGRAASLDRLAERGVLIVHEPGSPRVGTYGDEWVVALDNDGVVGIGDPEWFRSDDSIAHVVAEAAGITVGAPSFVTDDEEEDFEE